MVGGPEPLRDKERLLRPREVAERTQLSYHAVLRAIHRGELRAFRVCQRIRLRAGDVEEWIQANPIASTGASSPPSPLFRAPQPERGSRAALRALEKRTNQ